MAFTPPADCGPKFPPQHQPQQPGKEYLMNPLPQPINPNYKPSAKLLGKVALVTGGDSGIGRSVCIHFAMEGATVGFTYVKGAEDTDKNETIKLIKKHKTPPSKDPIAIPADFSRGCESECQRIVNEFVKHYKTIDILVNDAAVQYYTNSIDELTEDRVERTFRINIFAYIYMARISLKHMKQGSSIVNVTSVLAYVGSGELVDYSATKGAILTFTRSLALKVVGRGIRVNGVAPGPIWTPLQVASLPAERVATLGCEVPMQRAGQPFEVAAAVVFLASNECSSYFTGQVLHPNGGG
ncbi:unnamed protein product [Linum tenue]|uniref:Uncharacterized protein n=1 Tax=Linum tenue TaxID=586396 RepID=A0AAV0P6L0_9ROSI|nr:unnamed protein product [Linum tenue]